MLQTRTSAGSCQVGVPLEIGHIAMVLANGGVTEPQIAVLSTAVVVMPAGC